MQDLLWKLAVMLTFLKKTAFHFQGGSELFGSLVFLCKPYCLIPRTREIKAEHRHILSLPGLHQQKEKNNGLSGIFSIYSLLTGATDIEHALVLPILSESEYR
jgi:hypothetical protein